MTLIWHTNFKHITQSEAIPSGAGCVAAGAGGEDGGREGGREPACAADNGSMDIMGAIRPPPRASRIFWIAVIKMLTKAQKV